MVLTYIRWQQARLPVEISYCQKCLSTPRLLLVGPLSLPEYQSLISFLQANSKCSDSKALKKDYGEPVGQIRIALR